MKKFSNSLPSQFASRRRSRRNPWRLVALAAGAVLVAYVAYLTVIVFDARQRTARLVSSAMASASIKVVPADFPAGRLDTLLAVQDPQFHQHRGVNWLAPRGRMTTVTQSLVKHLYFDEFRPGVFNKLKQTVIARFALDPLVSKQTQLTLFVNTVYLGNLEDRQVYGFSEAALAYFGKTFAALSDAEYLSLVAMLDAPNALSVATQPSANARRVAEISTRIDVQGSLAAGE
jgi:membrane peptidoglycan carboxypeptidase